MKSSHFVDKLKKVAPSDKQMKQKHGLSDEYIKKYQQSFICVKISDNCIYQDQLLDLVSRYDVSKLEIGIVTFNKKMIESDNYFYVGKVEADDLVIDKNLGIVKVVEYGINHVIWECAKNSSSFLDAILVVAEFLTKCSFDDNLRNNQDIKCSIAQECAEIAGGNSYVEFYNMLVGCWK